jgi:hypothetical protein
VLSLTRFGRGAEVDHAARGFACTVLALDLALPASAYTIDFAGVLTHLLESCLASGVTAGLDELLAWLVEVVPEPADAACAGPALAEARASEAPDDPRLPSLRAICVGLDPNEITVTELRGTQPAGSPTSTNRRTVTGAETVRTRSVPYATYSLAPHRRQARNFLTFAPPTPAAMTPTSINDAPRAQPMTGTAHASTPTMATRHPVPAPPSV